MINQNLRMMKVTIYINYVIKYNQMDHYVRAFLEMVIKRKPNQFRK
jgi:hypothetical protein